VSVRAWLQALFVASAVAWPAAAATFAQADRGAAAMQNPVPATPESIDAGKRLFQRHCASCHGANAEGGSGNDLIPAAPDLTDKEWKHGGSDGEIFSAIKNGIPPDLNMIPFGDQLKDQEIWSVVNYIRSLAKKS
jgi:cbb3-type cytochrome c oxidase subunit III